MRHILTASKQDLNQGAAAAQVEAQLKAMQSSGCLDAMDPKSLFSKMLSKKKAQHTQARTA